MHMKRYSPEHIKDAARRFANSNYANAWNLVGPEIRRALIDSCVMRELRIADSVDSNIMLTAGLLVAFRDALEATLERRKEHPVK